MLRSTWPIFSLELRKILSYRVDFWVNFVGSIFIDVAIAYFLWAAVFRHQGLDSIGGYSLMGLVFYYTLVPIVTHMTQAQVMHFMSDEIYTGQLNRYLIYPLSFFHYKLVAHFAFTFLAFLQFVVVVGGFWFIWGFPSELDVSVAGLAMGIGSCAVGALIYFFMAACLEMVSFWADQIWTLLVILKFASRFLGGAMIPVALFPGWAQNVIGYLPFYYFLGFPIDVIMGRIGAVDWGVSMAFGAIWALTMFICAQFVWSRGKRVYTGVGI